MDANVAALNNKVSVYIKPTDKEDTGRFGEMEMTLDARGNLFAKHSVSLAAPIKFTLKISGNVGVKKSEIEEFIKKEYSYDSLPFDFVINVAEVSAKIQSRFNVNVQAFVDVISTAASGTYLEFLPQRDSILFYNESDRIIGFDSKGMIWGQSVQDEVDWWEPIAGDTFGSGIIYKHTEDETSEMRVFIFNGSNSFVVDAPFIDAEFFVRSIQNNGYTFVFYNDGDRRWVEVFANSQITVNNLTSSPIPLYRVYYEEGEIADNAVLSYSNGVIYIARKEGSVLFIDYCTIINAGSELYTFFTLQIPYNMNIYSLHLAGEDMYVFGSQSHGSRAEVIYIRGFRSQDYTYQILPMYMTGGMANWIPVDVVSSGDRLFWVAVHETGQQYFIGISQTPAVSTQQATFVNAKTLTSAGTQDGIPAIHAGDEFCYFRDMEDSWNFITEKVQANTSNITEYRLAQTGSVDYQSGLIVYSIPNVAKFEYIANELPVLEANSYLMLNEETPVVWQE